MAEIIPQTESSILSRLIEPGGGGLNVEVANSILDLRFSEIDVDRMNELADKNRQGQISTEEREELESYSRVGNLLNLLQSKARHSLRNG